MTGTPARNVVLVCVDQWRGDCLSVAGHPVVRTPTLDGLAMGSIAGRPRGGVRFGRAYSAVPTCIPARAALHTGLSQRGHGRVGYRDGVDWRYPTTLAGEFGRHGYQTHAVGKMHVHPPRNRIGFDSVDLFDGYLMTERAGGRDRRFYDDYLAWLSDQDGEDAFADYVEHGVQCNSVVARPWDKPERLHPTNWVTRRGIEFLYRRDPTVPFLLYLSFWHPHPPYTPPAWAFEQYLGATSEPVVGDWVEATGPWRQDWRHDAWSARYDDATLARARAGYFGHMSHIDLQLNRFFLALLELGLAENTWLCFTSDHGELLGDHHLFRKGPPYEGSTRIPLILSGPDGSHPAGERRDEVVELRDVMPTLLDCAGLPVPESVDGRSVLPLACGERVDWRPWLHGEHVVFDQSVQWLTDGRQKYIWFSADGREQLFDLVADPHETRDLAAAGTHAADLAAWRERLVTQLRGRPEGYVHTAALVTGKRPALVLGDTGC